MNTQSLNISYAHYGTVIAAIKNSGPFIIFWNLITLTLFVCLCIIEIVNCKQLKQQCEEKMW